MKETLIAVYERESTLWKNANGFYHAQNWTTMICKVFDYSEEIANVKELGIRWNDANGNDVTDQQIEARYGKPYMIKFVNQRKTNAKCYWFKTKEEANSFFKQVMKDRILGNFKKVS